MDLVGRASLELYVIPHMSSKAGMCMLNSAMVVHWFIKLSFFLRNKRYKLNLC